MISQNLKVNQEKVDDEKTVAKPMFSKVFVKSNGTL
jgi:hypothetical protein